MTPVTQSLVDWSKVGPMARKPRNEALIKKELELFVMQEDQLAANRDYEGRLSRIDFPLLMVTDDARGVIEAQSFTREQYFSEMKPFWDAQPPVKHRLTISVLSDALATIIDDYTFTVGARRITARASALVVKRGGQWKWKSMTEAGWSGVGAPAAAPPPQAAPPAAAPPAQAAPPAPVAAPPTRTLRAPPALEPVAPQPQPAPAAPPPAPAPAPPAPRR